MNNKSFFSTKTFLGIMTGGLLALSIFLWKSQEAKNLSQLHLRTESRAINYGSDAESRYRGIFNALNRIANLGAPQQQAEWENEMGFYLDAYEGIKHIAWVDKNFVIQMIVPRQENAVYLDQTADELVFAPTEVNLMVPVYQGPKLEGFVFGTIRIDVFFAPVINNIHNDYMLQLTNEGKIIFTSDTWITPSEEFAVNQTINLQDTAVLNLTLAPTAAHLKLETANAQKTLLLSLLFSCITIVAVHFAQNFSALSRLNQARFQKLLEDVQLVAVTLDVDGRVTFCNDYLLALTGWQREEVLGSDWFERFAPSDWEQVKELFQAAVTAGNFPAHYENPILTRSGEQRWVMFNNTVLRDTRGNIIGVASLGEDITDRKRAEERAHRLLEQQVAVNQLALALGDTRDLDTIYQVIYEHVRILMDAQAFIIAFYDSTTRLIQAGYVVNSGEVRNVSNFPKIPLGEAGKGSQSQVIHTGESFYIPDYRSRMATTKTEYKIAANGTISEGPPPESQKDSTNSALYVPMKVEGKVIGVIQVQSHSLDAYSQEDIGLLTGMANVAAVAVQNARLYGEIERELAKRIRAEEALKEYSERLEEMVEARTRELRETQEQLLRQETLVILGQLAGSLSHELRNPLGVISNAVYYLKLVNPNMGEQTRQYLGIIEQETRIAEKIITALFDYASPKAGNREPVSVAGLVHLVLERYPAPKSVFVSFDCPDNLPKVFVDAGQIEQVLGNLVENAYQAMPQGGQVTISAQVEKETIALAVQDTGIGIPPENMANLFEPLFSTKTIGIGLGLAVSQKLVEANDGRIEVESEPGAGTTFTIYLPILPMKTEA